MTSLIRPLPAPDQSAPANIRVRQRVPVNSVSVPVGPAPIASPVIPSPVIASPAQTAPGNSTALQAEIDAKVADLLAAREAKNKAASEERAAEKALSALFGANDLPEQSISFNGVSYRAGFISENDDKVDVEKLRKIIGDDAFMAIASATKTDVKKTHGDVVLAKCLTPIEKAPTFKVKEVK